MPALLGAGGRYDNVTSRVTEIQHSGTPVVQYAYNGLDQVVLTDYPQPEIMWDLSGASAGDYPDLDRFNRVTTSRWTAYTGTDVDFFDLDIAYDRNSNITRVEDNVHVGFDWSYTMDSLDRLSRGERGTWSGSITSQKEDQTWTLDQVGNWDQVSLDFNADNSYGGAGEYNDDRTHNTVNELTARDTDDNGSENYTLTYDAVGNLTDDAESYEYVYDPFGRLRKVNTQASALVAEYKYNGLGYMIAVHEDTDTDADVDSNDKWFYPAYDERWRMVANFRESDTAPKEEWVNQDAGLDGRGRSSYINGVVLRNKDANTAWTSASDGNLEERIYLCQNWRGDASALVYVGGDIVEQVRYSPYGTPVGLVGGDTDSDGDCNSGNTVDTDQIQTWINGSAYDVRGDLDLNGVVNSSDKTITLASYQGLVLGRDKLSAFGSKRGLAGYSRAVASSWYEARNRDTSGLLGRWGRRDPLQYVDNMNLYQYVSSQPITAADPFGSYMEGAFGGPARAQVGQQKKTGSMWVMTVKPQSSVSTDLGTWKAELVGFAPTPGSKECAQGSTTGALGTGYDTCHEGTTCPSETMAARFKMLLNGGHVHGEAGDPEFDDWHGTGASGDQSGWGVGTIGGGMADIPGSAGSSEVDIQYNIQSSAAQGETKSADVYGKQAPSAGGGTAHSSVEFKCYGCEVVEEL